MFGVEISADWQYVTDPHWRSSYEAPRWVFDIIDKESTVSTQKMVEVLSEFTGELMSNDIAYSIRSKLLPFFGDRCLEVKLDIHVGRPTILIEFEDDDGIRRYIRLT